MLQRLKRWLKDEKITDLERYFSGYTKQAIADNSPILLVQGVEDYYYYGLFGQIICSLRQEHAIRVDRYVLRSLREGESKSVLMFLFSRLIINPLHNYKWAGHYRVLSDNVAFNNTSFRPISDLIDLYQAWLSWRSLNDSDALLNLTIADIPVGDLINDSFIRYKPAPTVNLNSIYLWVLLWQTYRTVRRATDYFQKTKPTWYLSSYSTYIDHGVPARIAVNYGVQVYTFGNYQEFAKQLTIIDSYHTKNTQAYASQFSLLADQENKLKQAELALAQRLSGCVDNATAYMKQSAYAASTTNIPDVQGGAIIFLHDFYDSPHVYQDMIFPDFWHWICFTIETLTAASKKFFIKPHPNQIKLSSQVLIDLTRRYPDLAFIPSEVNNKQLVDAGISCAITVYGTIAHEMAYLGIPCIACAKHPHISFNFCRTAKNTDEYTEFLLSSISTEIDKAELRKQSLMFYYMHNLNLTADIKSLIDSVTTYRLSCYYKDNKSNLALILSELAKLAEYQGYLNKIISQQ